MMEAHHSCVAKDVCEEDVIQPMEGVETGSEASIVQTGSELPSSSSIVPSADATGAP